LFFVVVEESVTDPEITPTPMPALNGEEKAEDWLQVGKRNRTHVLRTVIYQNIFLMIY
jgi:hypothetical protein